MLSYTPSYRLWALVGCLVIFAFGIVRFVTETGDIASEIPKEAYMPTIRVGTTPVRVHLATTTAAQERGLSGVTAMGPTEGMLFVFLKDGDYRIWMRDMHFPLDVFWIASDGRIVHMVQEMRPDSYPQVFGSPLPARYILEVPAGFIESYNITKDDRVQL